MTSHGDRHLGMGACFQKTELNSFGDRYLSVAHHTQVPVPVTIDASDLADETEPQTDTYQLEVPAHDRITFSTLISRMGWRALSLRNVLKGKAAIF